MERFDRKAAYEKWMNMKGKLSVRDIRDSATRETMATLLENQERLDVRDLNESAQTTLDIGSNYGDGAKFSPIALALVRRVFPDIFAHKVIGVQALNGPVGLAYALRYAYDVAGVPPTSTFNGGSDAYEAGFKKLNEYSGYTGSVPGSALSTAVSALYDATNAGTFGQFGTGAVTSAAEAWKVGTSMPNMKLFLDKAAIQAQSRKLGAAFSLESAQDLKSMQGIEIEREMLNILNYEVAAELDREILGRMMQASINVSNGGELPTVVNLSATDGRWSQEKFSNLVNVIVKKANDIATATFRSAGNFVIVSPRVATALQAAGPQFTVNTAEVNASTTLAEIGKINGTITVYRDTYAALDYALVGYKGPSTSDTGLIYSPYITGLFNRAVRPDDFGVNVGVMSRYAITDSLLGSGRYYRTIVVQNLAAVLGA
jgi:hypothetical protein